MTDIEKSLRVLEKNGLQSIASSVRKLLVVVGKPESQKLLADELVQLDKRLAAVEKNCLGSEGVEVEDPFPSIQM